MSLQDRLAALKSAFENKVTNQNSNWKLFYQFWKMPENTTAVVRFLPDADEESSLQFLVEKLEHELNINGERTRVPCLTMFGKECPICELSRKYYDEKNDTLGKRYYRKKSYIGQVVVIESPIEHNQEQLVKLIDIGPKIFKQIQAAFQSGDLEDVPYDLHNGYNFRIKKTKNGQYASYDTSSFSPKQSDLGDDVISNIKLYNLSDFRGKELDRATVEAMLVADQTGAAMKVPDHHEEHHHEESEVKNEDNATHEEKQEEKSVKEHSEKPTTSSKASTVLEQLRARAKAAAQAKE